MPALNPKLLWSAAHPPPPFRPTDSPNYYVAQHPQSTKSLYIVSRDSSGISFSAILFSGLIVETIAAPTSLTLAREACENHAFGA